MQNVDQIIHAPWIITSDTQIPFLENHSVVIHNGIIVDILPTEMASTQYQAGQVDTCRDKVLLPGFVNAHTHIGMNFFRGLADDLGLMTWLEEHIFPAEKKWLDHQFVKDASLFAMAEMIRSGTTCFNDMYYFLEATAEAAIISGMRAHIGISVLEFPTNWATGPQEYLQKGIAFHEVYLDNPLITTTLAPHAPYTVSDKTFMQVQEIAQQYQLKINLHLHETEDEIKQSLATYNKRPIRRLNDLGFLASNVIAIHMVNLNEEDLGILAKTQPSIVHCPESNMKLASGISPVSQLRALKLNVALGTDSAASNNDLDMFGEMRQAAFLAKASSRDAESISAWDCIHMATQNGATALGSGNTQGSISKGKVADLITVDLDQLEAKPLYHPASQIVYSSCRSQVADVWVAGKALMKNRQLLTLDENELKSKASYWQKKIAT